MCNAEMEMDLILNGVTLKACDFCDLEGEANEPKKGTRKPTDREKRINATDKAKQKAATIAVLRQRRKAKAEKDGEMIYFRKGALEWEIHDSKLWKPMNKR